MMRAVWKAHIANIFARNSLARELVQHSGNDKTGCHFRVISLALLRVAVYPRGRVTREKSRAFRLP